MTMQASNFEEARPSDYLMRLAASDHGKAYKSLAMSEMAISPGHVVLDLGCGPGADLPAFADAVGKSGRVIGVDHDADAVRQARDRTAGMPQVEVREADIHALGIPAGSVDRVHADRVLQHVTHPKPCSSRHGVFSGTAARPSSPNPTGTLVIDYPDLAIAHVYTRFITDHVIHNPAIGRQLARRAMTAGFQVRKITPVTAVYRDVQAADQILGIKRVTVRAVSAGYLTQESADLWLSYLATEPFFASGTLYVTTAVAAVT